MTKTVIVKLSATPEKFLEKGVKGSQCETVGCLYPYLETKKLLDGSTFIKKAKTKKSSPKLDVCKNFDNTKLKPVLPDDAPIAVVLFAGGGGIEAGMVQAGIRPVIAVEFDPTKPELSRAIAKTHHRNFSEYGCRVVQLTVQEIARLGFLGFPRRPDYLHASPVCANFSQAHTAKAGKGGETTDDLTAAIAVAKAIRQLQPRVFTLENVPRYQNSQSFSIILSALEQEGYLVNYSVVNMADFGLPQARRRLVLVASRGFRVALPTHRKPIGWYDAIAHLIPMMTDSQLLPKQRQALEKFLAGNAPTPLCNSIIRISTKYLEKSDRMKAGITGYLCVASIWGIGRNFGFWVFCLFYSRSSIRGGGCRGRGW